MTTAATTSPERIGFLRQLGIDTGYTLLGFPLAIAAFVVVVAGLSAGLGTLVIVVGLPVLVATVLLARLFADVERLRIGPVLRKATTRPVYRTSEPGDGVWKRMITPLTQTQSWLDLAHAVLALPDRGLHLLRRRHVVGDGDRRNADRAVGLEHSARTGESFARRADRPRRQRLRADRLPDRDRSDRACSPSRSSSEAPRLLSAGFSRVLLIRLAEMRQTITVLTEQKAAAVSAEATALRRLERDIHDGPQQRLIRLAMDLGRARQQLDTDPDSLAQSLDEAIGQTRETLDELRALSRGIAPPVLADRGLPSALAALAGRCTVPVELAVDPQLGTPQGRLDPAVENTAYFSVAEALTNVAKHSRAASCRVTVANGPDSLGIEIVDDGDGGAHVAKGHGLAGLSDRVRATGGTLTVTSPDGGPTEIRVEVPC